MQKAFIYKPSKTSMQMGRGETSVWVLEFEKQPRFYTEPIMGWRGSMEFLGQIRIKFKSLEQAVLYASRQGLEYSVRKPQEEIIAPKSYSENFSSNRVKFKVN